MPKLSVWMIRTALVYLGIGILFGALLLANKGVPYEPQVWRLLNPHIEFLIFGWMIQLAMGVAFWTLPRFSNEHRYGKTHLGWMSYVLLNGGTIITAASYWLNASAAILVGNLLTLAAVFVYTLLIWPRVKPLGSDAAKKSLKE
jgi:hypothetical protein